MSKVNREGERNLKEVYASRLRNLLETSSTKKPANLNSIIDFISTQMSEFSNFELNIAPGPGEEDFDSSKPKKIHANKPGHEFKTNAPKERDSIKSNEKDSSKTKSKERNSFNSGSEENDSILFESRVEMSNERNSSGLSTRNHDSCQHNSRKRSVSSRAECNRCDISKGRNSKDSVSKGYFESAEGDYHEMRPRKHSKLSELEWPRSPVPELIIECVVPQDKHDDPPEFYRRLLRKALKFYKRLVIDGEDISDVSTDASLHSDIETGRKTNTPTDHHLNESFETVRTSVEITGPNVELSYSFQDHNIEDSSNKTTLKAFPIRIKISPRSKTNIENERPGRPLNVNKEISSTNEKWSFHSHIRNEKASKNLAKETFLKPTSNPYRVFSGPLPGLGEVSPRSFLGSMEDEWSEDSDIIVCHGGHSTPVVTDTRPDDDTSDASETMFKVVTFRADVHTPQTMTRNPDHKQNNERRQVRNIHRPRDDTAISGSTKTPIMDQSDSQFDPAEVDKDQEGLENNAVPPTDQITSREEIEEMRCPLPQRATSSLENKPYERPTKDDECSNFNTYVSLERATIENTADDAETMDYDQEQSNGDHVSSHSDRNHSNDDIASSHTDHATIGIRKRRSTFPLPSEPKHVKFLSKGVQTDINNCEYCSSFTSSLRGETPLSANAELSRDESNKQTTRTGSTLNITDVRNGKAVSSTVHSIQGNTSNVGIADATSSQRGSDVQNAKAGSKQESERGAQVSKPNPQSVENNKTATQNAHIESNQVEPDARIVTIAAAQDSDTSTGRAKDEMNQCKSNAQTTNDGTRQWQSNARSGNEETTQRKSNTQRVNEESTHSESNTQSANKETNQRESNTQSANDGTSQPQSNPPNANEGTSQPNPQSPTNGSSENIFYDIKFVGRQIVIKNCHCSDCPVIAKMFTGRR